MLWQGVASNLWLDKAFSVELTITSQPITIQFSKGSHNDIPCQQHIFNVCFYLVCRNVNGAFDLKNKTGCSKLLQASMISERTLNNMFLFNCFNCNVDKYILALFFFNADFSTPWKCYWYSISLIVYIIIDPFTKNGNRAKPILFVCDINVFESTTMEMIIDYMKYNFIFNI